MTTEHHHFDQQGVLIKCYHECKSLLTDWRFFAGITLSFPLEHFLWEKVWPFSWITAAMGL